ncbi:MAG: tetratricopeptide repeat protein [Cyanobacteria bacterium HKST-UBA01]|nr:tetratricopeptide repeat protein [Cyanobacteria bacterium HKST-UBA01]
MIALPGLIPRSSPMAWFVTLLAVFGAPVGIELMVSLHRTGWLDAITVAIFFPTLVLVALLLAASVMKGLYPWRGEVICSGKFWILQFFILLGGTAIAALVLLTLCQFVCWGDHYRVNSLFFFPKLDTGTLPGFSLAVDCLIAVTMASPIVGLAQAALYRREMRTDWFCSFFALEVQGLSFLCFAFISWAMLPFLVGFFAICGHPIYFEEKQNLVEAFRLLTALSTVPFSLAGIAIAFAPIKNVRIPWSYNFVPLLVAVNTMAALLITCCLCIQSYFPTKFLEFDSSINHFLGRDRRALSSINAAIKILPKDPGLYFQRAELNSSMGTPGAVASDYEKSLILGGDSTGVFAYLVDYKHKTGDLAGARRLADLFVAKHPNSARAYICSADIHQADGERELARFDYNQALKRLSSMTYDLDDAWYCYGRLGNVRESERIARLLIKQQPRHFGQFFRLSLVLNKQHRYKEAVHAASESIKLNPSFSGSYCSRGAALYNLGEYRKALPDLCKAIGFYPQFGKALYYRSRVYEKLGERSFAAIDLAESKRLGYSTEDDMWF